MTTGSPTLVVTSLTSTTYADGSSATACAPALTTRPVSTKTRNTAVAAVRARNMKAIRERNDGGMQRPAANTGGWLRETNEGFGGDGRRSLGNGEHPHDPALRHVRIPT